MATYYGIESSVPIAGVTKTLATDFVSTNYYVVDVCRAVVGVTDCGATVQKLTGKTFKIVPGMNGATVEWVAHGGTTTLVT